MSTNNKGIFPLWMNEQDVITQLLNKMLAEGGKVPYSFVINPEHDSDTQERMKRIVTSMQRENLLIIPPDESGNFELGLEGSRAALMGYKRFKGMKRWGTLSKKFTLIFSILILVGGVACLLYLLLRYFKII